MKLQELLDKATPRPWLKGEFQVLPTRNPLNPIDTPLARHAVNNFEGLLKAAKDVLPCLKTRVAHVEAASALRNAIRQAEEVGGL